jgi:hypothetical protein
MLDGDNRLQVEDILNSDILQDQAKAWIRLSRAFNIYINDHNKLLLTVPSLKMNCVLKEVFYFKVRKL